MKEQRPVQVSTSDRAHKIDGPKKKITDGRTASLPFSLHYLHRCTFALDERKQKYTYIYIIR